MNAPLDLIFVLTAIIWRQDYRPARIPVTHTCRSNTELWTAQGTYKIPAEFILTPEDPITGAVELATGWMQAELTVGKYIDNIYEHINGLITASLQH